MKIFEKTKESHVDYRLFFSTRKRIYRTSKGKTKSSYTKDILGIDINT